MVEYYRLSRKQFYRMGIISMMYLSTSFQEQQVVGQGPRKAREDVSFPLSRVKSPFSDDFLASEQVGQAG